jgi:hypothetical protein
MPSFPESPSTAHGAHDPLLIAALAAGDLDGPDLERARAVIDACADCRILHTDLQAIAKATAGVPPPIASPGRDFRLTPQQAADLRPARWRRLASLRMPRVAVTRSLGAGLATLGIVGLLIGNVHLGFGSAASVPATVESVTGGAPADTAASPAGALAPVVGGPSAAASSFAGALGASARPAASGVPDTAGEVPEPSQTRSGARNPAYAASPGTKSEASMAPGAPAPAAAQASAFPANALFGAAIVIGLILLLASRRSGARPA